VALLEPALGERDDLADRVALVGPPGPASLDRDQLPSMTQRIVIERADRLAVDAE
jgi:hypothetical protein